MIDLEKDGSLWVVTLNRPDKANSLTKSMLEELDAIARDARGNAKALILTGAGKVFSAGADLDAAKAGLATDGIWESLSGNIAKFDGVSIAALNGTLAGGAFGMALACDIRIAVSNAKFFYPVMKLGFLPQPSDPMWLRDLVGPARAKMVLLGGARIEAGEALNWGLIDRIVEQESLLTDAKSLCEDALGAAPQHISAIKALIG